MGIKKILKIVLTVAIVLAIAYAYYNYVIAPNQIESEFNATTNTSLINVSGFMLPVTSSGALALEIQTTQKTDYTQYLLTYLLSGFFLMFYLYAIFDVKLSNISIRLALRRLKKKNGRHILFIKHTQQAMFSSSMINQETLLKLNEALDKFKGQPFDLVLHTPGGSIFDSLLISRIIKNYPGEVRVFIPLYAMSGGTCLALSGSKIFMNDVSCMGPVDPQLGNLLKFGSARGWNDIVKFKGKRSDDQTVSFAMMGRQYTKTIANHLDYLLKDKMNDKDRKKFVKFLTDGKVEHAYALTPTELKKFNFNVDKMDAETNKILMKVITSNKYEGLYHTGKQDDE